MKINESNESKKRASQVAPGTVVKINGSYYMRCAKEYCLYINLESGTHYRGSSETWVEVFPDAVLNVEGDK